MPDEVQCEDVVQMLAPHFDLQVVGNGEAALAATREHPPDALLSAVAMPGFDGLALLRAIRADPQTNAIPFILISARPGDGDEAEAIDAGADDYLPSPFKSRELIARIESRVRRSQRSRTVEEMVQHTETKFRTLAEATPAMVWVCRPDGYLTYLNRQWIDYTGQSIEASRGNGWAETVHPEDRPRVLALWEECTRTGELYEGECRYRRRDGEYRWHYFRGAPAYHPQGHIEAWYGVSLDIERRRRVDLELVRSRAMLETETEALAGLNNASSRLWRMRRLNHGLDEILSATMQLLHADAGVLQIVDEESANLVVGAERGLGPGGLDDLDHLLERGSICGEAVQSGESTWLEDVLVQRRESGSPVEFRAVHCTPLVGKAGQRLGVLTLLFQSPQRLSDADLRRLDLYSRQAVDFLERCTFEERLRASDRRFRNLADTAPAMLWVTDGNGACTFLSRGWHEYTGQSPEAALGWGWLDAVHPDDRDQCEQALQDADSRHVAFTLDYRLRRFDGAYRWAFDAGRPRFDDKGGFLGFIGSVIDIHERRQAEDTRRDVEQRFQLLADNMSELAWIAEADGRINWCNRRWFEYTGMNARESNGWGWTLALHPEEISRIVERVRHTIDAGATWEDTILLRGRDNRYRWFLSRATPVCDDKGRATRWLGTHTDVTEQRAAQDLLREADSRKDRVLATLAHELRNPLAPLRNGLQLLKLAVDNPETVGRTQSMMERQLEQMVRLVDDLQDLSRVSQGKVRLQFETIDLAAAVRQAIETNGPACSQAKHRLFTSFPAETVYVTGDFTRLAQVFANLIGNAIKFTDPGGTITIRLTTDGADAVVTVIDTGIGLQADALSSIFEMFTQLDDSLERTRGGLGIGLSLVKQLVVQHGGSIEARSEGRGSGSEFTVRLPRDEHVDDEPVESVKDQKGARRPRRILIVDDNADVALSLSLMLELSESVTETASDGLSALKLGERFRPDLILLDLGMPHIDGFETARRIRARPWGANVLLVALTGWSRDEDIRRTREVGFDRHLIKPVDRETLEALIAEIR